MKRTTVLATVAAGSLAIGSAACSDSTSTGTDDAATLTNVSPPANSTNVSPNGTIEITFDQPMQTGMEEFANLHMGDVRGPMVDGDWMWSEDHMVLTFSPHEPLMPATSYTIHLGGGMRDDQGHEVDFGQHGLGMGGIWATEQMMYPGGMMGGSMGNDPLHGGEGWRHRNGRYGMVFTFTTAG